MKRIAFIAVAVLLSLLSGCKAVEKKQIQRSVANNSYTRIAPVNNQQPDNRIPREVASQQETSSTLLDNYNVDSDLSLEKHRETVKPQKMPESFVADDVSEEEENLEEENSANESTNSEEDKPEEKPQKEVVKSKNKLQQTLHRMDEHIKKAEKEGWSSFDYKSDFIDLSQESSDKD